MFEMRLDDVLITRADDWREAHVETIDYLLGDDSPTLKNFINIMRSILMKIYFTS